MNILDELLADHRRLHDLLSLFERELVTYDNGGSADLQLIQDIAAYYAEYFNRVHHPLEDCLFECLLSRAPRRNAGARSATSQHDSLRCATDRLLAALDRALHDTMATRAELTDAGRQFLQQNRDHMRHEESHPFKQARQCLTARDWQAIDTAADAVRARTDLEHGRRQYDALLASLHGVRPGMSAADNAQAATGLRH